MKHIKKAAGNEPPALARYRTGLEGLGLRPDFTGYVDNDPETGEKKPLKMAIGNEQGWICCYCMRRIWPDKMTVEHYITQNRHDDSPHTEAVHISNRLVYMNLLGSCNSSERNCSELRGNKPFRVLDPRDSACEPMVNYEIQGKTIAIVPADSPVGTDVLHDLDSVAFLNAETRQQLRLSKARFEVYEKVVKELIDKRPNGDWTTKSLESKIEQWLSPQIIDKNGTKGYREFCMVAVWYLRKKLSRPKYNR